MTRASLHFPGQNGLDAPFRRQEEDNHGLNDAVQFAGHPGVQLHARRAYLQKREGKAHRNDAHRLISHDHGHQQTVKIILVGNAVLVVALQAVNLEHPHQAADRAGNHHGGDDGAIHFQSGIPGKPGIFPDQLHFVALGGFCHHVPDQKGDDGGGEDRRGQVGAFDQPGELEIRRQCIRAGDPVALGGFPGAVGQIGTEIDGDGIHHDRGDDLVDLQLHLQYTGNPGVEAARGHGAQRRQRNDDPRGGTGHFRADVGGYDGAQIKLTLAAHIEDAHPGADGASQPRQKQHHGVLDGVAELTLGKQVQDIGKPLAAGGAFDQLPIGGNGIMAGDRHDGRAHQQRQYHRKGQRGQIAPVNSLFHGWPPLWNRSYSSRSPLCPDDPGRTAR